MTSAATGKPGIRARKMAHTRNQIGVEGIRLIEEQGFTQTTVEQIAAAAGVSPSTFFRHFPCKEALLFGGDRDYTAGLDRLEFPPEGESLGESLRQTAIGWEQYGDAHQQRRRSLRFALQDQHLSILVYLDQILRQLEPGVIRAVANRLRVHPDADLRPLVVAQLHTALARLVIQRPPGDQTEFLDQWFHAAARVLEESPHGAAM